VPVPSDHYLNHTLSAYLLGKQELTDEDLDNISTFALHIESTGLPHATFNRLRHFFRHRLKLDTEYLIQHQIDFLLGVVPIYYDMCIDLCCLYVGKLTNVHIAQCVKVLAIMETGSQSADSLISQ
jgi:hypothetical protein